MSFNNRIAGHGQSPAAFIQEGQAMTCTRAVAKLFHLRRDDAAGSGRAATFDAG
ncbi:hypothetical protein OK348_13515 [Flavobacterium sp. MXW15]|uniref:Uncharacterized protein n=1 Tax=Xanthomonas chitinilytica TaxID=2989819 RepID=A0ABT3JX15_9XANT|nr:hypothetical protein [Xanthomonas sp. H13-6]MCW4455803.1 hypothetical protein [Flavobacterium sp. MXW15]MCW4473018.1 hypothetical protein [Xanthomonas sp. H13-6]